MNCTRPHGSAWKDFWLLVQKFKVLGKAVTGIEEVLQRGLV